MSYTDNDRDQKLNNDYTDDDFDVNDKLNEDYGDEEKFNEPYDDDELSQDEVMNQMKNEDDYAFSEKEASGDCNGGVSDNKGRKKKNIKSEIVSYAILAVILGVLFYSGFNFFKELITYKKAENEYAKVNSNIVIREKIVTAEPAASDTEDEENAEDQVTYPELEIDYDELKSINENFVGVIYIPALELYYPVAQSKDNNEYLSTTFEGSYNPAGCIFLDKTASADLSDNNTFIFGHNMKNETMFGSLKKFQSQSDLCASDPYIYIYTKDKVFKYHIFAYYTCPVDDVLYDDFEGDAEYDKYVQRAQNRSLYNPSDDEKDDFSIRPELLTLSTCYGVNHTHNFIVQGALTGTADTAETAAEAEN